MMISNTCKYAIRSIIYIALNQKDSKNVGIKEIAENLELPAPFLSKILQQLAKKKIVNSIKGPNGGFSLDKSQAALSVWEIVDVIDGTSLFTECFFGINMCKDDPNLKDLCPAHAHSEPIRANLKNMFKQLTITKFAEDIEKNIQFINI